jgi:superfamily II DNA or RNA helicase
LLDINALSWKDKSEDRNSVFERFKNEHEKISIICNVRILSEGVDLPSANMWVFMDSKKSRREIIQNVGRVMRRWSNYDRRYKYKKAIVLVPINVNGEIEEGSDEIN